MYGPQIRRGKECNHRLEIFDDCGDNSATMCCQLQPNHEGPHQEQYNSACGYRVTVIWEKQKKKL